MKKIVGFIYAMTLIGAILSIVTFVVFLFSFLDKAHYAMETFMYFSCCLSLTILCWVSYTVTKACWIYIEKNEQKK